MTVLEVSYSGIYGSTFSETATASAKREKHHRTQDDAHTQTH